MLSPSLSSTELGMIKVILKAPGDGIDPTAIFHPLRSADLQSCGTQRRNGTGPAAGRQEEGESLPMPGQPTVRMLHHSLPLTAQPLAHSAEHDKDISHPLNLITGLLNNRVA